MTDTTPTLTDEQREALARVLHEHPWERAHYGDFSLPSAPIGKWGYRCPCGEFVKGQAAHREHHADALAPLIARMVADAERRALREFIAWVATARAFNGSEYRHGQSLYNECINAALPEWAEQWLRARADSLAAQPAPEEAETVETGLRALAWQVLSDHQWRDWSCSCGQVDPDSREYEDNHLADALAEAFAPHVIPPGPTGANHDRR